MKEILKFCRLTKENFFESFLIEKSENGFIFHDKSTDIFQVHTHEKGLRKFIKNSLSDQFKLLPNSLSEFSQSEGIIQKEDLYNLIIDRIDVDEHAEEVFPLLRYDAPKTNFFKQLSHWQLDYNKVYTKEDVTYKVLESAISGNIMHEEEDYARFREAIVIKYDEEIINLTAIPSSADKLKIGSYEISLSKILPDDFHNSNLLNSLLQQFIGLGLSEDKLNQLFGISEVPDLNQIFKLLKKEDEITLVNAHQLAFIMLYSQYEEIDLTTILVETLDNQQYGLEYPYYINKKPFIADDAVLEEKYNQIGQILKLPLENSKISINYSPYFKQYGFFCPDLKGGMNDIEKENLLDFLFSIFQKERADFNREKDWDTFDEQEAKDVLSFTPSLSVYPSRHALKKENFQNT